MISVVSLVDWRDAFCTLADLNRYTDITTAAPPSTSAYPTHRAINRLTNSNSTSRMSMISDLGDEVDFSRVNGSNSSRPLAKAHQEQPTSSARVTSSASRPTTQSGMVSQEYPSSRALKSTPTHIDTPLEPEAQRALCSPKLELERKLNLATVGAGLPLDSSMPSSSAGKSRVERDRELFARTVSAPEAESIEREKERDLALAGGQGRAVTMGHGELGRGVEESLSLGLAKGKAEEMAELLRRFGEKGEGGSTTRARTVSLCLRLVGCLC
jgi:hypothetical protein